MWHLDCRTTSSAASSIVDPVPFPVGYAATVDLRHLTEPGDDRLVLRVVAHDNVADEWLTVIDRQQEVTPTRLLRGEALLVVS